MGTEVLERTSAQCTRGRTSGLPITEGVLTALAGAPRPGRASLPNILARPPPCHAGFAAASRPHQLDREVPTLGPTTNEQ